MPNGSTYGTTSFRFDVFGFQMRLKLILNTEVAGVRSVSECDKDHRRKPGRLLSYSFHLRPFALPTSAFLRVQNPSHNSAIHLCDLCGEEKVLT